ncbi:hypothetical protein HM1_0849 [Heliomicrobium modesticaldum Ice1]|uniref:Uncharacterized protein n=1 Tax=Heliobacterium modesticaldum (strain ATCC 51547 / Ice1) TaxID=498761 RepID=B0TAR0_HELMI|nr:hypothetical protein HM1_0849 [Heliomicrobium modesticaldum Ice1]
MKEFPILGDSFFLLAAGFERLAPKKDHLSACLNACFWNSIIYEKTMK